MVDGELADFDFDLDFDFDGFTFMDKYTFYREASTYIAMMLDSEKAIENLFHFIRQTIPLFGLSWHRYDSDFQYLQYESILTQNKFHDIQGRVIPTSHAIRESIIALEKSKFRLVEKTSTDPLSASITVALADFLGKSDKSVFMIYLEWMNNPVGLMCLYREESGPWPEEHLELLRTLDRPLSFATFHMERHMELVRDRNRVADEKNYLVLELRRITESRLIGADSGLKEVMKMVEQLAETETPVLITGETGVGKEVVADAIHRSSARREGPYIKVNCGAIPHDLIDSELFGHEKGAFTGAHETRKGKFERANGGTIFLDEIGELPLQSQVRLLRVLQNREAERVGGQKTFSVNVRVITATNRNLQYMVDNGQFRDDLFFRVNVFPIVIPPLRHRKQDIPTLVSYLLNKKMKEMKLTIKPDVSSNNIKDLMNHDWPGNVRELENLIERALIINPAGPLDFAQLLHPVGKNKTRHSSGQNDRILTLEELNRGHIEKVLALTKGRINGAKGAAELLDIYPNTLRRRMDKLGIAYGRNQK